MGFLLPLAATAMGATAAEVSTMATIGSVISAVGTVAGTIGQFEQGQATAKSERYNAQVARQNAELKSREGEQQASTEEQKTRARVGGIIANQGASGVDINSGSAVDVRSSAASLGELNAINIRSNAAREAYSYQQQANLDSASASSAETAGDIGAATTFLGGMGQNINQYENFMMNQGLPMGNVPVQGETMPINVDTGNVAQTYVNNG